MATFWNPTGLMVSSASSCPTLANAMTTQARKLLDQAKTRKRNSIIVRSRWAPNKEQILASARGRGRSAARAGAGGGNRPARRGRAEAEHILDEAKTSGRGLEFGGPGEDDTYSLLCRFGSSGD
jgi:hypothetical protein